MWQLRLLSTPVSSWLGSDSSKHSAITGQTRRVAVLAIAWLAWAAASADAEILRVADLNASQLRALDRSKTVVLITGGMLEEHGPYLPTSTDAVLSERLTQEVAQSIMAKKPGGRSPPRPATRR